MKLKIVKKVDAKKKDARPQIRIKAAGNVFVEVYKDGKGYFYRIDVPGATDFVSKERFENQDKARLAGVTHAKKFIGKVRGDQKKKDSSSMFNDCHKYVGIAYKNVTGAKTYVTNIERKCVGMDLEEAEDIDADLMELKDETKDLLNLIDRTLAKVEEQG